MDVFFENQQIGWVVGMDGAIFHTTDGGGSWRRQAPELTQNLLTAVTFVNADTGWAVGIPENGSPGTLIYTGDGGTNWQLHFIEADSFLFDIHFANAQKGWIAGANGTLLHTIDGGKTWKPQNTGTTQELRSICFVSVNEGWVVGAHGAVLHTTDGGLNWQVNAQTPDFLYRVFFTDEKSGWVVGPCGTLVHTTDGGNSWQETGAGLSCDLYDVDYADAHNIWAVGHANIFLNSVDGGDTWEVNKEFLAGYQTFHRWPLSDTFMDDIIKITYVNPRKGWALGAYSQLYQTVDGGRNWEKMRVSPLNRRSFDICFIDSLRGWVSGYWGGGGCLASPVIKQTLDGGLSWQMIWFDFVRLLNSLQFVNDSSGWRLDYDTIFKTNNGGRSWQSQQRFSFGLNDFYFFDNQMGWIVADAGKILHTLDGGQTWIQQNSPTTESLRAICFLDSLTGWIAGSHGVILHTTNGGEDWEIQPSGTTTNLNSIKFFSKDQGCAVGEKGVILKYGKSMQIDDQVPAAKQVSDFHLENNFPNPFNRSTTFNLHLHKPTSLKIVIYDILGREVKELMQQSIESGRFSVTWQGEDMRFAPCPSGIYFACFTIGHQKIYKKIFLLR
jgi:photosystem II stability/assembly factor-like uncharacterized protein